MGLDYERKRPKRSIYISSSWAECRTGFNDQLCFYEQIAEVLDWHREERLGI